MGKLSTACVILSAGKGTRMKSNLPKVLHEVAGLPMLGHVLKCAASIDPQKMVVVTGVEQKTVMSAAKKLHKNTEIAIQKEALGTGNAVQAAQGLLKDFDGVVFVLFGDTPLIRPETLKQMLASESSVTVLGMRPVDPAAYGRLICNEQGHLRRIVEFKEANAAERAVNLCNSGVMAVQSADLFRWLGEITNDNAKGEYYLTDIVELAVAEGKSCTVVEAEESSLLGVNDRIDLSRAESQMQQRLRTDAMRAGVTMIAPDTVMLSHDTILGNDVLIEPNVFFGQGVSVHEKAIIRAFSHLEGCSVNKAAIIGPYARLRPGAAIGEEVKVGNFVEIKNAQLEKGAKVNHLSYVGDAHVGQYANIGAGTITCNYDGFQKYHTSIGDHAFIGSNSALVAPVQIGEGALIGAGSVITEDVDAQALSMTRPQQLHRAEWAKQFRNRKQN